MSARVRRPSLKPGTLQHAAFCLWHNVSHFLPSGRADRGLMMITPENIAPDNTARLFGQLEPEVERPPVRKNIVFMSNLHIVKAVYAAARGR